MGYEKRQSVSIEKDYKKLEMVRSPQMEEVTVDKNQVLQMLMELDVGKTVEPNKVNGLTLKERKDQMAKQLHEIIRTSMKKSTSDLEESEYTIDLQGKEHRKHTKLQTHVFNQHDMQDLLKVKCQKKMVTVS